MNAYRIRFKNNQLTDTAGLNIACPEEYTYRILLDNGDYHVRIYDGDPEDEGDVNVYTILNGVRQKPLWAGDRCIRSMDYRVTVTDGELTIAFEGKYICIQGIEIAPDIQTTVQLDGETAISRQMPAIRLTFSKKTLSAEIKEDTYHLYKKKVGSGIDPECITVIGNTYTDTEVVCCGSYEYWCAMTDCMGFEGEKSDHITITAVYEGEKKGEVKTFTAGTTDEHHTVLHGTGTGFAYRIYRKTEIREYHFIGEAFVKSGENGETVFTYTDDTMITDRVYIYGVQALDRGGVSEIISAPSQVRAPLRRRQMEKLDRAALAIATDYGMYVTFRLFADEYEKAGFAIYADGVKIAELTKDEATNYCHKGGTIDTVYEIRKVTDGVEESEGAIAKNLSHSYFDIPLRKPEPYKTPDGNCYEYTANDASAADLDGDGEYELILKWDCNGKDNSHKGYSGECLLDAYKLDGTFLWRINLGKNIRCGAHYTQFQVYDYDGDGYAEVVVKTADGTTDGLGHILGDEKADYRNEDGFIIEGPEYLSLFDGRTGAHLDTVPYDPPRGKVADWGDSWGNRVDRFLACTAYLDGVHPSVVMCRGYYDHGRPTQLTAYDVVDKKLVKRWKFRADQTQNIEYTNQGFHNLAVADVDGDGCDEIVYGACVIDHDGTGLYSTGLGHGDAMHVGRFTAESKGFDYFGIHEEADCPCGIEARDAGTGKMHFGLYTGRDTTRGLTAKIDPRHEGNQMWACFGGGLYNYSDGSKLCDSYPKQINFAVWWDGDLLRELLDHDWFGYQTGVGIPKIYKWNWKREETEILFATDGVLSNNGTKGNPCLQASLIGDWREELIFRGKDSTFLRCYTTTYDTPYRIYTLMHDVTYRLGIAWQNTAYNQPPQTGFYIGPDMKPLKEPAQDYVSPC